EPEVVAIVEQLVDDGAVRAAGEDVLSPRIAVDAAAVVRVLLPTVRDLRLRAADHDGARVLEVRAPPAQRLLAGAVLERVEIAAAIAGGLHHDDAAGDSSLDGGKDLRIGLGGQIRRAVVARLRVDDEDVAEVQHAGGVLDGAAEIVFQADR